MISFSRFTIFVFPLLEWLSVVVITKVLNAQAPCQKGAIGVMVKFILDPRALVFYHVTDSDKSSGKPWTKLFRYLLLVETKKARLIGQSATR